MDATQVTEVQQIAIQKPETLECFFSSNLLFELYSERYYVAEGDVELTATDFERIGRLYTEETDRLEASGDREAMANLSADFKAIADFYYAD